MPEMESERTIWQGSPSQLINLPAFIGFAVLGAAKPNAFGTAIGALFVGVLLQGLTMMNAPYYTQDFVKGAVLVVALVFTFALSNRGRT